MPARYVYVGRVRPEWHGRPCDPVMRPDGKCIIGRRPRNQLVRFADDGSLCCVPSRTLRLAAKYYGQADQPPPVQQLSLFEAEAAR